MENLTHCQSLETPWTTTINIELQKYGEKLMQNKIGAIVAIEPSSEKY